MGTRISKVLIPLTREDLQQLTQKTYFNAKEIKVMYKRYWAYCSSDATLNKKQFYSMFNGTDEKVRAIADHIFRTSDKNDNLSLDFTEFLTTLSVILRGTDVQKAMWAFHFYDEDDSGTIEIEKIEHVLDDCNRDYDPTEIRKLFSEMDRNKDGIIDINEFTAGCRKNDNLLKNVGIC